MFDPCDTVAGIKHSCSRSKVYSENLDLPLYSYVTLKTFFVIIALHFPSKLFSRCFIYLVKLFFKKSGLRRLEKGFLQLMYASGQLNKKLRLLVTEINHGLAYNGDVKVSFETF